MGAAAESLCFLYLYDFGSGADIPYRGGNAKAPNNAATGWSALCPGHVPILLLHGVMPCRYAGFDLEPVRTGRNQSMVGFGPLGQDEDRVYLQTAFISRLQNWINIGGGFLR